VNRCNRRKNSDIVPVEEGHLKVEATWRIFQLLRVLV